jgi:hypothetical protein
MMQTVYGEHHVKSKKLPIICGLPRTEGWIRYRTKFLGRFEYVYVTVQVAACTNCKRGDYGSHVRAGHAQLLRTLRPNITHCSSILVILMFLTPIHPLQLFSHWYFMAHHSGQRRLWILTALNTWSHGMSTFALCFHGTCDRPIPRQISTKCQRYMVSDLVLNPNRPGAV